MFKINTLLYYIKYNALHTIHYIQYIAYNTLRTIHKVTCPDIVLVQGTLKWATSLKYLGVSVLSRKKFTRDFSGSRSYFSSFNTIYGRVGSRDSSDLLLSLLSSVCTPTPALLFGVKGALGKDRKGPCLFARPSGRARVLNGPAKTRHKCIGFKPFKTLDSRRRCGRGRHRRAA